MNKANLKSYAPGARTDFIAAVTARANILGIQSLEHSNADIRGDVVVIDGREWPLGVAAQRGKLIERIARDGYAQTMEAVAYTWFNRFAALRYMEIHDYLGHGWRVLSSRDGGMPEILTHATEVALSGLDVERAREMQLAGNRDNELYKALIVAQCNELSRSMSFLFERIDDESELLLPDNLLRTDSIIAKLVESVPEADWDNIEAIGWLYQFYISERKAQVIGKVVKSEDIPAATQLFTPNWIVKYLVQNSVGRLWLSANDNSQLRSEWKYLVDLPEQTPLATSELNAISRIRIAEDGERLDPESIKIIDPACGSGHILVEAYEALKAIYLERGYRLRDIPRLILEKNLVGIDIDERAAQLSGFALLMKARADDRRIFESPLKLNIISLQQSSGLDLDDISNALSPHGISRADVARLLKTFEQSKTFGSLIKVDDILKRNLQIMDEAVGLALVSGDLLATAAANEIACLIAQASLLSASYDAVIANPPYMGGKGMNAALKEFAKVCYPDSKADLFSMFIERGFDWCKPTGFNSMVTMQSWMFLSSFEKLRDKLLSSRTLTCLSHMGNGVMGIAFGTSAAVFQKNHVDGFVAHFSFCGNDDVGSDGAPITYPVINDRLCFFKPDDFKKIPGSPVAYWVSRGVVDSYDNNEQIYSNSVSDGQNITANNAKFLRYFWELDSSTVGSQNRWVFYAKGGGFRKWFGNLEVTVDWSAEARAEYKSHPSARIIPEYLWFKEGITWTLVTSSLNSFRILPEGSTFDKGGSSIFMKEPSHLVPMLAFLNSNVAAYFLKILSSTINLQVDEVRRLPFTPEKWLDSSVSRNAELLIASHKTDDASREESWSFLWDPLVQQSETEQSLRSAHKNICSAREAALRSAQEMETENNRQFIAAYGLMDELSPYVPDTQITMSKGDGPKDAQRFISYVTGCAMGRYSLDSPGLIYAASGNRGFDLTKYESFPADADGIIPVTDELWFEDDLTVRIKEFVSVAFGKASLNDNMQWLAENLGAKDGELPEEAIRRYVSGKLYKDHLQIYKKRPIYWMFSSGKLGAFQALVYVNRYVEGSLSRMRSEYVVPLSTRFATRIEMLEKDLDAAGGTGSRVKLQKQIELLKKKQRELMGFDERLRHYADMRVDLRLEDGVRHNYAKFGDLLADTDLVVGASDE